MGSFSSKSHFERRNTVLRRTQRKSIHGIKAKAESINKEIKKFSGTAQDDSYQDLMNRLDRLKSELVRKEKELQPQVIAIYNDVFDRLNNLRQQLEDKVDKNQESEDVESIQSQEEASNLENSTDKRRTVELKVVQIQPPESKRSSVVKFGVPVMPMAIIHQVIAEEQVTNIKSIIENLEMEISEFVGRKNGKHYNRIRDKLLEYKRQLSDVKIPDDEVEEQAKMCGRYIGNCLTFLDEKAVSEREDSDDEVFTPKSPDDNRRISSQNQNGRFPFQNESPHRNLVQTIKNDITEKQIEVDVDTKEEIELELLNFQEELQKYTLAYPKYEHLQSSLKLTEETLKDLQQAHSTYTSFVKAQVKIFEHKGGNKQGKDKNPENIAETLNSIKESITGLNTILDNHPFKVEITRILIKTREMKQFLRSIDVSIDQKLAEEKISLENDLKILNQKASKQKQAKDAEANILEQIQEVIRNIQKPNNTIIFLDLEILDGIKTRLVDYKKQLESLENTDDSFTDWKVSILSMITIRQNECNQLEFEKCRELYKELQSQLSEVQPEDVKKFRQHFINLKSRILKNAFLNQNGFLLEVEEVVKKLDTNANFETPADKIVLHKWDNKNLNNK